MFPQRDFYPPLPPEIASVFEAEGITLMGITPALSYPEKQREYEEWIKAGHHGEMGYLASHAPLKYNPAGILAGAKSLLVCGLNYHLKRSTWQEDSKLGRIASYAYGRDYHKTFKKKLQKIQKILEEQYPEEQFRSFTDTSPLDERFYAEQAGIGFVGKNDLLLSSVLGSFFFLGEIISTKEFTPSKMEEKDPHGACPVGCFRCFNNCPTGALTVGEPFRANLCISYLTIEFKGSIPLELRPQMGNWLFGCDLCQSICPFNLRAKPTDVEDFKKPIAGETQELKEILALTPETFLQKFAGSPVMRAGRDSLVRNACIVAGNSGNRDLKPQLAKLASEDASEMVREHAVWALEVLEKNS